MALLNDQPRMSTIVTLAPVELLVLEKGPYLSLLQKERKERLDRHMAVLRQVHTFHDFPEHTLELVAEVVQEKVFNVRSLPTLHTLYR